MNQSSSENHLDTLQLRQQPSGAKCASRAALFGRNGENGGAIENKGVTRRAHARSAFIFVEKDARMRMHVFSM